jgi:hypothetical protein
MIQKKPGCHDPTFGAAVNDAVSLIYIQALKIIPSFFF